MLHFFPACVDNEKKQVGGRMHRGQIAAMEEYTAMATLEAPLPDVDAYVAFLAAEDLPVLRRTVHDLMALRDAAESVNAKRIAAVVLGDPLMTLKLLAFLQSHRPNAQNHDITTIDRAIMMLGVEAFFKAFESSPTLEKALAGEPRALVGVLHLIGRARKAAHYARDWAIARHDLDVDEITVAALLSDISEILCWIFAPQMAMRMQQILDATPGTRSAPAFESIFGVERNALEMGLVLRWNLPRLLVTLLDESCTDNPRVRNVRLASNFVRHLTHGWDDPALPDDIDEIESLLRIGRDQLLLRLGTPAEHAHRFLPPEEEPQA